MGYGQYSIKASSVRATTYTSKSSNQIFTQNSINNEMNPYGIKIREARDSEEHPNTIPIIIGLDVTGSMGSIPLFLVREGLHHIMGTILQSGISDPQLMFIAIGDHECDQAPLQVGQFELSDDLLDKWLTTVYLEGAGGGNAGESYLLAWYFAAYHTSIDCFEKRNKRGFLFTIGDEPTLREIKGNDTLVGKSLKNIMGNGQYNDFTHHELFEKALEKYHVFHLHIAETLTGQKQQTIDGWKQLIGDSLIIVPDKRNVAKIIADKIIEIENKKNDSIQPELNLVLPETSGVEPIFPKVRF